MRFGLPRLRVPRRLAALLAIGLLAGCGAAVLPSVHSEAERFAMAQRLAEGRHYADAAELLKVYIANNAGSADVDKAVDLLGECYLKTRAWAMAATEFERLLRDYPESDSCAAAAFGLGEAYFGQSRSPDFDQEFTLKAEAQWQSYLRAYPDHWRIPEARHRLMQARMRLATKLLNTGNLYLKMGQVTPARIYFERVDSEYPDTPQRADAWVGLALCDVRQGRRAEAVERLKRVETEFAGRPAADRAARERARLQR